MQMRPLYDGGLSGGSGAAQAAEDRSSVLQEGLATPTLKKLTPSRRDRAFLGPRGRTITIGARTQYVTRVSDEDYDFLMQYRWTFAVSHPAGGLVYARRSIRDAAGRNVTVLMHHVVLARAAKVRPSEHHTADHRNGHSLDNRRFNLGWATGEEQMAHRFGRIARAVRDDPNADHGENEIPF